MKIVNERITFTDSTAQGFTARVTELLMLSLSNTPIKTLLPNKSYAETPANFASPTRILKTFSRHQCANPQTHKGDKLETYQIMRFIVESGGKANKKTRMSLVAKALEITEKHLYKCLQESGDSFGQTGERNIFDRVETFLWTLFEICPEAVTMFLLRLKIKYNEMLENKTSPIPRVAVLREINQLNATLLRDDLPDDSPEITMQLKRLRSILDRAIGADEPTAFELQTEAIIEDKLMVENVMATEESRKAGAALLAARVKEIEQEARLTIISQQLTANTAVREQALLEQKLGGQYGHTAAQ